jgi:hypothetical protein
MEPMRDVLSVFHEGLIAVITALRDDAILHDAFDETAREVVTHEDVEERHEGVVGGGHGSLLRRR